MQSVKSVTVESVGMHVSLCVFMCTGNWLQVLWKDRSLIKCLHSC